MRPRLFIGWDPRQMAAYVVAHFSAGAAGSGVDIERLALAPLVRRGLYTRPTRYQGEDGSPGYWDVISDAPMSTGHAISRFLVPTLAGFKGWALFTDGDVLFRRSVRDLFALADSRFAIQVVQHDYAPLESAKMDGQQQTRYFRKNWSSVMLFNCEHPANAALTPDLVNAVPGRDLHRFCWLEDRLIGSLPQEGNFLVGHTPATIDPAIVHFTEGVPDTPGYEHCLYADEWYATARAAGYRLSRPPRPEEEVA